MYVKPRKNSGFIGKVPHGENEVWSFFMSIRKL